MDVQEVYNSDYYGWYGHDGKKYKDHPLIIGMLDDVANFLCSTIEFETHMDIGCAMGYLVKSMRERNKESYGIDVSEYAIFNADESVLSYVKVGSILRPISGSPYDLVTCIEVLEHIEPKDTSRAVLSVCDSTRKYIFFSSAYDKSEPTHINIHSMGYWLGQFEQHGFKFMPYKFSGIPWAMLLERI